MYSNCLSTAMRVDNLTRKKQMQNCSFLLYGCFMPTFLVAIVQCIHLAYGRCTFASSMIFLFSGKTSKDFWVQMVVFHYNVFQCPAIAVFFSCCSQVYGSVGSWSVTGRYRGCYKLTHLSISIIPILTVSKLNSQKLVIHVIHCSYYTLSRLVYLVCPKS